MRGTGVVVDVWAARPTTALTAADLALLDATERVRAAALPGVAAHRFTLGRVLLRHAVAARIGCAPAEVGLRAECPRCGRPHGRVTVVGPSRGSGRPGELQASVTRAGPVVAVAVCEGLAVGIDAEATAAVAAAPLADVALSPAELARHRRRSGRGAIRSLARAWVRKEAALKALGTGLDADPASVELRRAPAGLRGVDAVVGGSVAVADLRLGRGRVGAVAVVAPGLVDPASHATGEPAGRLVVRCYDGASTLGRRS